jgi:chitodextrinase
MVTADSLILNWTKGTDNITVEGDLQYAVYMSYFNNMNTLADTLSNGIKIKDFARNISVVTVDKLQPVTTYYFNIVVRDSFGNMSTYNTVSAQTLTDTTGPTPGGGGVLVFNSIDKDSMIVSWNQAEDNASSGAQIQYQLRMAMSNLGVAPDFSTVAATEAHGVIVKAYSNATYALVSNLASNTNYYFNVIAKDSAGNKSVYTSAVQKTANNLVEIPTEAVEINQPVVIASNKDEIKTLPAVASHPTLSKPSNWKKVHMVYKSITSSKRVVVVITDFSQMSGQFISKDTEQFVIHKIIVEDENNNFVTVPANSILNSESWSISVT